MFSSLDFEVVFLGWGMVRKLPTPLLVRRAMANCFAKQPKARPGAFFPVSFEVSFCAQEPNSSAPSCSLWSESRTSISRPEFFRQVGQPPGGSPRWYFLTFLIWLSSPPTHTLLGDFERSLSPSKAFATQHIPVLLLPPPPPLAVLVLRMPVDEVRRPKPTSFWFSYFWAKKICNKDRKHVFEMNVDFYFRIEFEVFIADIFRFSIFNL